MSTLTLLSGAPGLEFMSREAVVRAVGMEAETPKATEMERLVWAREKPRVVRTLRANDALVPIARPAELALEFLLSPQNAPREYKARLNDGEQQAAFDVLVVAAGLRHSRLTERLAAFAPAPVEKRTEKVDLVETMLYSHASSSSSADRNITVSGVLCGDPYSGCACLVRHDTKQLLCWTKDDMTGLTRRYKFVNGAYKEYGWGIHRIENTAENVDIFPVWNGVLPYMEEARTAGLDSFTVQWNPCFILAVPIPCFIGVHLWNFRHNFKYTREQQVVVSTEMLPQEVSPVWVARGALGDVSWDAALAAFDEIIEGFFQVLDAEDAAVQLAAKRAGAAASSTAAPATHVNPGYRGGESNNDYWAQQQAEERRREQQMANNYRVAAYVGGQNQDNAGGLY